MLYCKQQCLGLKHGKPVVPSIPWLSAYPYLTAKGKGKKNKWRGKCVENLNFCPEPPSSLSLPIPSTYSAESIHRLVCVDTQVLNCYACAFVVDHITPSSKIFWLSRRIPEIEWMVQSFSRRGQ